MKRPIVMFGDTNSREYIALLKQRKWGRMFADLRRPRPFPGERWGFDNGAFKTWQNTGFAANLTVDDWAILFDVQTFERRLREAEVVEIPPYLAVVPDIPASRESLRYSVEWRRDLVNGWPWYLAVQDGMTPGEVAEVLPMFAGLFLGGSDKFKLTAYTWARLAHKHHRKFHYARAGTPRKIRHAFAVASDSLDSTFASWTKARTRQLCAVWDGLGLQDQFWPVNV